MFDGRSVLPVAQIDVAERIMRGGKAALVVRPCEKFERGFEQGERKVCAVATQVRRPLGERASPGLIRCIRRRRSVRRRPTVLNCCRGAV